MQLLISIFSSNLFHVVNRFFELLEVPAIKYIKCTCTLIPNVMRTIIPDWRYRTKQCLKIQLNPWFLGNFNAHYKMTSADFANTEAYLIYCWNKNNNVADMFNCFCFERIHSRLKQAHELCNMLSLTLCIQEKRLYMMAWHATKHTHYT